MKPPALARLRVAVDFVADHLARDVEPSGIIAAFVATHGAAYRVNPRANSLCAAGVSGTCDWSEDKGLLEAWLQNARRKLEREAQA